MAKKNRVKQVNPSLVSGGKIKSIPTSAEIPFDQQYPTFSLIHVQKEYCITRCQQEDRARFANTLRKLSKLRWNELSKSDRHGLGYEKIKQSSIKIGIPAFVTEEVKLIAFRFSGLKAMVGYREGATFHILWFDDDFKVYDH